MAKIIENWAGKRIKVANKYVWRYQPTYGNFGQVNIVLDESSYEYWTTATLTGEYKQNSAGNIMLQTLENPNIYIDITECNTDYTAVAEMKAGNANDVIKLLVENQKAIFTNNIICARFAYKLTDTEKQTLYDLQIRLNERNEALKDKTLASDQKTAYTEGAIGIITYLTKFMADQNRISGVRRSKIGVVINLTVIIVSAMVLTAVSTTAYFIYKAYLNQSNDDLKYSDELTKVLNDKLTDKEREMLYNETNSYINLKKMQTSTASTWSTIKTIALVVGGGFLGLQLYKYFKNQDKEINVRKTLKA